MAPEDSPTWWLFHVDLDQFLAAVEIRRDPTLVGRPVVVGGDGDPTRSRQVVATASYEARALGVHSGMPLRAALRKAPDAVFLPTDRPAYDAASAEVMEALRSLGHPVEVWGWDEAYLGADVAEPAVLADAIRARVRERTGLSCAVGIGDTKERAKMATSFGKPGGVFRLDRDNWWTLMGARPAVDLWGVGARTAARLTEHGVATIADLGHTDPADLAAWFGPTIGPGLRQLARGGASRTIVAEPWVRKSVSKQTTYPHDLRTRDEVAAAVLALLDDVHSLLVAEGRLATHVGITVRTSTFFTRTKASKIPQGPTADVEPLRQVASRVLDRFDLDRPVRLLGVRLDLADAGR